VSDSDFYGFWLPFALTNGNDGRGRAWYSSANNRKKFEKVLRAQGFERVPFEYRVKVTVTRILGKGQRLWDSSSIGRGNWKEIEDSLVAVGFFYDDGPKCISETRFLQDDTQRENGPKIHVKIERDDKCTT